MGDRESGFFVCRGLFDKSC